MFVNSEEARYLKDQYESAKSFRKSLNLQKDSASATPVMTNTVKKNQKNIFSKFKN